MSDHLVDFADWYDLIISDIPEAAYRATKHYIGGHSLGGTIAAFFVRFDSLPLGTRVDSHHRLCMTPTAQQTPYVLHNIIFFGGHTSIFIDQTSDAGYNQAAGFIAYDTTIT